MHTNTHDEMSGGGRVGYESVRGEKGEKCLWEGYGDILLKQ